MYVSTKHYVTMLSPPISMVHKQFALVNTDVSKPIQTVRHKTSLRQFWQCHFEIGSVSAERVGQGEVGQGEVGGCTRRVQTAWPCLASVIERYWLVPEATSVMFCHLISTRWVWLESQKYIENDAPRPFCCTPDFAVLAASSVLATYTLREYSGIQ